MQLKLIDRNSSRYPILALKSATVLPSRLLSARPQRALARRPLRITFYGTFALRFLDARG